MIVVREATTGDIPEMSRILTASIVQLCSADHGDDPDVIAGWTRNKSEQGVRAILKQPAVLMLVATAGDGIVAVGCIVGGNQIGLNYVAPEHRFRGASAALLVDMEARIRASGYLESRLTSTATARSFYLRRGWIEAGPGAPRSGYPMHKAL